jgi:iron-sulfur cluster assembly protein
MVAIVGEPRPSAVFGRIGATIGGMDTATQGILSVTDKAASKVKALSQKEGRAEPILRLRVVAGGCSGFSYELSFEDAPEAEDSVIRAAEGVRVLVDPRSAPIVAGSTLDLDENLIGGGLRVRNPQAVHECACGESFSI